MPTVVALVPMRDRSERVPGKNFRLFAGEPLYRRIVRALLDCALIDQVAIDTDSLSIAEDCRRAFPGVRLIPRPEHLRAGNISMNEVLCHDVRQVHADYYVQTHSTNPLLGSATITSALDLLLRSWPAHDSLFSVTPLHARLWDAAGHPLNHDPAVLRRTQDLPPIHVENSCLYIFGREVFEQRRNRIGFRPLLFPIALPEAWDIDEELDFELAEYLFGKKASSR